MAPKNFGRTRVVTPPSPILTGLSLTVTPDTGQSRLGPGPVVFVPHGTAPEDFATEAEIAYLETVSADTVTLRERAIEGTTARYIDTGWDVIQGVTAGEWNETAPDLVAEFYAQAESYIAHRGCGDEAPENTLVAYRQAISRGHTAIEVSSQVTVDGVPVVMHDSTVDRTTTLTGNLADFSLAQLSAAVVDYGTSFLGPGWSANLPVPTVGEVLELARSAGRVVFLEPKADATRTLAAATAFQDPGKWIVWKFNRGASGALPSHATAARAAGLPLWVYMTSGDANSLVDTVLATLRPGDAIGVDVAQVAADSTKVTYLVAAAAAAGIEVIGFVVRTRAERDSLAALGVNRFMCTSVSYLSNDDAAFTTDGFSGGVRRPGDYAGASNKLATYSATADEVLLAQGTTATVAMGSMCPVPDPAGAAAGYRIAFEMKFPTLPGDTSQHIDLYLAHLSDAPYAFQSAANTEGGYHVFQRANGGAGISRHTAGSASNTTLTTGTGSAAVADTWMQFQVDVTATQVIFRRLDGTTFELTATDATHRGGYFGLSAASSSVAPKFRNIVVSAL